MNNGNQNDQYNDGFNTQYPQQPYQQQPYQQQPYQQQPYQQQPYQQQPYQQQPYQQQPYQQQPYQQQPYQQQPYQQQPYQQQPYQQQPYQQQAYQQQAYQRPQRRQLNSGNGPGSGQATIGMVLSVISIPAAITAGFLSFLGIVAFIINIIALGLGIVGLVMSASGGTKNMRAGYVRGGMSVAGIVCGIVGVSIAGLMLTCTGCVTAAYCTTKNAIGNIRLR